MTNEKARQKNNEAVAQKPVGLEELTGEHKIEENNNKHRLYKACDGSLIAVWNTPETGYRIEWHANLDDYYSEQGVILTEKRTV